MRVLPTLLAAVATLSALVAAKKGGPPPPSDDMELVRLISLSRHGSRAPNPTVKKLCPNNLKNMQSYIVPPEQLTERGMQQLEAAGKHIREVYVEGQGFLSPSFSGSGEELHFESYFRADAANRCGQSAISFGYGLYPDGTGPKGYAKQPIPVYMQLPESEHDFTANVPCWNVMDANNKNYTTTRGMLLIEQHRPMLQMAATACGSNFFHASDPVLAIKDVSDMLLFDADEGLPLLEGMTKEAVKELSDLAFQNLIERLYSTPRDVTTAIGGFPQLLLDNLNEASSLTFDSSKSTKFFSYHCHRELLHGLGYMLGMRFNFDGLPKYNDTTALIPGTSLFFELHRKLIDNTTTPTTYAHFVKLFVWSPTTERTQIKLDKCGWNCPVEDLNKIIKTHIESTGTWQEICSYKPTMSLDVEAIEQPLAPVNPKQHDMAWVVLVVGGVAMLVLVTAKMVQRILKRRLYRAL